MPHIWFQPRIWFAGASTALVLTMAALASASQSPAAAKGSRSSQPRPGLAIALTGCLEASAEPRVFLLTNAVRDDDEAQDQDESNASTAASKGPGRTYRIVPLAAPQLDLKSHVGEKVEVGGRFVTQEELHKLPKETDATGQSKPAAPTIAVTYVRKSASSCGDKQP